VPGQAIVRKDGDVVEFCSPRENPLHYEIR